MTDLPGKPGKHEITRFSNSASAALKMIRAGSIATTAGDHGAINAYRDDSGTLRGDRSVYKHTAEQHTFGSLKELARWYRQALKAIE